MRWTATCLMLGLVLTIGVRARAMDLLDMEEDDPLMQLEEDGAPMLKVGKVQVVGIQGEDRQRYLQALDLHQDKKLTRSDLDEIVQGAAKKRKFVLAGIETTAAIFDRTDILLRVYYADPGVEIAIGENGALALALGKEQLVEQSLPAMKSIRFSGADDPVKPDFDLAYDAAKKAFAGENETLALNVTLVPEAKSIAFDVVLGNRGDKDLDAVEVRLIDGVEIRDTPGWLRWDGRRAMGMRAGWPAAKIVDYQRAAVGVCLERKTDHDRFELVRPRGADGRSLVLISNKIPAGEERRVRLSFRCGGGSAVGENPYALAADIFKAFAEKHPWQGPDWPDRRAIANLHPASAHIGSSEVGETTNPRGWFFAQDIDVTTEAGRADFKKKFMAYGSTVVKICKDMNAQGVLIWGITGLEYQQCAYYGNPQMMAELAPEMDAVADEWFRLFTDAGLRNGVCIRPVQMVINDKFEPGQPLNEPPFKYRLGQKLTWKGEGDQKRGLLDFDGCLEDLAMKIDYCYKRWGTTMYYVDTNMIYEYRPDPKTGKPKFQSRLLPYELFAELEKRFPQCLIIPEHENFMYWSCTAPLGATPGEVRQTWPRAFSVNLMQDVDTTKPGIEGHYARLVRRGDSLQFPGWYMSDTTKLVREVYKQVHIPKWHDPKRIGK